LKPVAFGFAALLWTLFRTLRLRVYTSEPRTNPYAASGDERFLYCVWHDSMVIPTFGGNHPYTTALTSQHNDGSFVAQVLRFKRIRAIRGSTKRITTGAMRELMHVTETQHLVITPDGPRGPSRSMSTGIAYIASRTGRAVVPTGYACSRYWRVRGSWSDLIIPKPFSKVVLLAGRPIHIPFSLKASQLQRQLDTLQAAMADVEQAAEGLLTSDEGNVAICRQSNH
jgi:lysophospholipid acyltransferase (LPLAT)-like uncharacterized protein